MKSMIIFATCWFWDQLSIGVVMMAALFFVFPVYDGGFAPRKRLCS